MEKYFFDKFDFSMGANKLKLIKIITFNYRIHNNIDLYLI